MCYPQPLILIEVIKTATAIKIKILLWHRKAARNLLQKQHDSIQVCKLMRT